MSGSAKSALVFQGGGALGAYELGAARALYRDPLFAPDLIAGVSMGAITAALLARPRGGMTPLQALEAFWQKVAVPAPAFLDFVRPYASFFGNEHFFMPRRDYVGFLNWTYFYCTGPLRETLNELLDLDALADKAAMPQLLMSATDLEDGQITCFYSNHPDYHLGVDHIMASGSLPPAFKWTTIGKKQYWDGGLFDNTPLGAVLDHLNDGPEIDRTVYVINLFPNRARIPTNMVEIAARIKNLQFANKSREDIKLLRRFNEVAALVEAIEALPGGNPLRDHDAYKAIKAHGYLRVPRIVAVTPPETPEEFADADFSPEAIERRASEGDRQTSKALNEPDTKDQERAAEIDR